MRNTLNLLAVGAWTYLTVGVALRPDDTPHWLIVLAFSYITLTMALHTLEKWDG